MRKADRLIVWGHSSLLMYSQSSWAQSVTDPEEKARFAIYVFTFAAP